MSNDNKKPAVGAHAPKPRAVSKREDDIRIHHTFNNGKECDVLFRPSPGDKANFGFGGFKNFKNVLNQKSYVTPDGILVDEDVAITLRDGAKIYADIYRPVDQPTNLPSIVSWGFYGKGDSGVAQDWNVVGVPTGTISSMCKFESGDPAYWVRQGYAVVNVDSRGAGLSEGNCVVWGEQDGRDGYDGIEWIAQQHWSNGQVGLFGNSSMAMCQWWIAAEQPPHLAAIAPWEGTSDVYREFICEGGIPWKGFPDMVMAQVHSTGYIEDISNMIEEYPLMNPYWESKIPNLKKIVTPAYVCGGWCHLHLRGSLYAFKNMSSPKKWLRVHREFEWPDTYAWWNLEDLKRFFDRYLKGIRNGWEMTPKVRLEVMDAYDCDFQVNRPEKEFPLKRTQYKKLYLNAANNSLEWNPVAQESKVSYDGKTGLTTFDIQFNEDVELTGYMKLHMHVAAESHDDMDLFFNIEKLDEHGNFVPINVAGEPYPGTWAKIRVSHRELDPELSSDIQPVMSHRSEQKLQPGEIVPIDVEVAPHSRIWHKGEMLRIEVAGRYIRDENWFMNFPYVTINQGNHLIYTGGKYDSYLQIPVIPPKYQAGDYIYR